LIFVGRFVIVPTIHTIKELIMDFTKHHAIIVTSILISDAEIARTTGHKSLETLSQR
jgi:hypothetical protein